MPEWYLFMAMLFVPAITGIFVPVLQWAWVAFAIALGIFVLQAILSANASAKKSAWHQQTFTYKFVLTMLYIVQPVARLTGRLKHGLTPWRKRGAGLQLSNFYCFNTKVFTHWSEEWQSAETWLEMIEQNLISLRTRVARGGVFDNWDIQVRSGWFTRAQGLLVIEEHGANKQYLKFRCRHAHSRYGFITIILLSIITFFTGFYNIWGVGVFTLFLSVLLVVKYIMDSISVSNSLKKGFLMLANTKDNNSELKLISNSFHLPSIDPPIEARALKSDWVDMSEVQIDHKSGVSK
jgi:hypothetical protein